MISPMNVVMVHFLGQKKSLFWLFRLAYFTAYMVSAGVRGLNRGLATLP